MTEEVVQKMSLYKLEKIISSITRFFFVIGSLTVFPMALWVATGSFARYVLRSPITGSSELTTCFLIFMIFMLIGNMQANNEHVSIGMIVDKLPDKAQSIVSAAGFLLCAVVAVIFSIETVKQGVFMSTTGTISAVLKIPLWPFYHIVAAGWALVALGSLLQTMKNIIKAIQK